MNARSSAGRIATGCLAATLSFGLAACTRPDSSPTARAVDPSGTPQAEQWTGETSRTGSGWYPMQVGQWWIYDGTIFSRIEGDWHVSLTWYGEKRDMVGTHAFGEHIYFAERQTSWSRLTPFPPPDSSEFWVYYRQDKAGLYERADPIPQPVSSRLTLWHQAQALHLDRAVPDRRYALERLHQRTAKKMAVVEAALRAYEGRSPRRAGPPGGALPKELTRLAYPLHPGQEWAIRAVPLFTSRVEAHEVFDLPAGRLGGFRLRIDSPLFGPRDKVELWYGRDGFLGMRAHLETVHVSYADPHGADSLRQITDEYLVLEQLNHVRR